MFGKFSKNSLSLGRVYDRITIREGNDRIELHVNADPVRLMGGLGQAQKQLSTVNENTGKEELEEIARAFSEVIFGEEQTRELFAFYFDDAGCVISVCGQYFTKRLNKLLTEAQKKMVRA